MPKRPRMTPEQFWSGKRRTMTAKDDLDRILRSVIRLPIQYWRPKFFFTGARDDHLSFNIPPSAAYRLRFRGEVPEECIVEISRRKGGTR